MRVDAGPWAVIGGLLFAGPGDNGLGPTKTVRSLDVLPPGATGGKATRLLAASEQATSAAFLVYDASRPFGSQWRNISIPETCGTGEALRRIINTGGGPSGG